MVKLVHFAIINANVRDVERLGKSLQKVVKDTKGEYEFLVTNDRVMVRDPRDLLKEYVTLLSSLQELVDKYEKIEKKKDLKNET